jgi:hypothetical protein
LVIIIITIVGLKQICQICHIYVKKCETNIFKSSGKTTTMPERTEELENVKNLLRRRKKAEFENKLKKMSKEEQEKERTLKKRKRRELKRRKEKKKREEALKKERIAEQKREKEGAEKEEMERDGKEKREEMEREGKEKREKLKEEEEEEKKKRNKEEKKRRLPEPGVYIVTSEARSDFYESGHIAATTGREIIWTSEFNHNGLKIEKMHVVL